MAADRSMTREYPVAIILPVHGAQAYLERTLNRLDLYNTYAPLVIVDDASDAATRDWLAVYRRSTLNRQALALLTNARQQLFTRTVNRGLRYAYHKWHPERLVVLNSDVELKPGWLAELSLLFADPKVGLAGYPDSPAGGKPVPKRMPEYVTGHCLMLRTAMLERIGILCETDRDGRQSPELAHLKGQAHIGSDRILSWRANAAGWKSLECQFPGVLHAAGKSWQHDLNWLMQFELRELWPATDTLQMPAGWQEEEL